MDKVLKYLTLGVLIILLGCSKDEPDKGLIWDNESATIINQGLSLDYGEHSLTLNFTSTQNLPIAVQTDRDWLSAVVDYGEGKGQLEISVEVNRDYAERSGIVSLRQGNMTTEIHVRQHGRPTAVTEENGYEVPCEENSISIPVKANGILTAEVYPSNCDWTHLSSIEKDASGEDDWTITISLDENTGLGRIAALYLKVEGRETEEIYIVQHPAPFNEEVTIEVEEPGMLQVLMGNDVENLSRIRRLTLIGGINGFDLRLLKKLFMADEKSVLDYPVSIDLSNCHITTSSLNNPFKRYGWKPAESWYPTDLTGYSCIPHGLFTNAANLTHVVLPETETMDSYVIERMAFSGCSGLKSIDIPYLVKQIGNRAFRDCPNLTEINIPDNSMLNIIGDEVFTTGSVIESLSLPEILVYISPNSFSGCRVKNLHLHWFYYIEEVEIVPETEGCTLYVPEGTADIYRVTPNWCNFQNIVEEPYTPYE